MKFARLAFPLIFFALTTQVDAQALCRPGTVVACTFLGKPGTKKCIGDGEFDDCVPNPPAPVSGIVFGKYFILTVVYAPPGTTAPQTTTGEQSFSQVSYEADSTTGSSKTISHSLKQDYQLSDSLQCIVCDIGIVGGGVSFDYTHDKTHQSIKNVNKKTTSIITDVGPVEDAVDHNLDQIWLLLRPKYDVTITGKEVSWALDADQSAGLVQYLYAGQLKDPSKIPPGVLQELQTAGITPADYQVMLTADPLAQCLPPVNRLQSQQATGAPPLPVPPTPCLTPTPPLPRYVPTNMNLPYDPPYAPGDGVPLQTYSLDNSDQQTYTDIIENDYAIGVTLNGQLDFLEGFKNTFTIQNTWTVQDINTTSRYYGSEQKASLTMGGPAYGYSGPPNMDVYYDTLYMTFAFVPNELSPNALHGVISSGQGKPVAVVTATAGGVKYRTYTNGKGEYHFSKQFSGPIDVQTSSTALHLPGLEAGKSVDLRLQ
jgi:hypothetical protein